MNTQNETQENDNARNQAKAQLESIRAMVAALSVDYDRLEELQDEISDKQSEIDELTAESEDCALDDQQTELKDLQEELKELQTEFEELQDLANGNASEDEAREAIDGDPLFVEVRSGWVTPGTEPEPEEFKILLCTGGPAVQIKGELDDYRQPRRAWLEYQDWGTPWTEYPTFGGENDDLLTYCQQFYFY